MHFDAAQHIELNPGTMVYACDFLGPELAAQLLEALQDELPWEHSHIRIMGRVVTIPRLQVWMGDSGLTYVYSRQKFAPHPWHPSILHIKQQIEQVTNKRFNTVLCNLYRDGRDSVAWHADDEPELGKQPFIASYSLGDNRQFQLRRKGERRIHSQLTLEHDSLLLMGNDVQDYWQHQIPKTSKPVRPRVNLTFRYRLPD